MTAPGVPGDAPRRLEQFLQTGDDPVRPAAVPERLGRLAVMHGCITLPQLEEALAEQDLQACRGETPDRLGRILVRRGLMDEATLAGLLEKQAARGPAAPEFKRYEIRRRLGEGAMSVVYEAADRELGRPVALKLLKESLSLHSAARERLRLEAKTLARLSHPNVVAVYDFAEEAGQACVVMELMEARSLRTVLSEKSRPTRDLLELLEKVAGGIQHAHDHGIIHRDLKPENILVGAGGEPKVADFGLARLVEADASVSASGARKGTPLYMAPEQVEGRAHEITPRTDVYALGVLLYEIIAGRPPFTGASLAEVFSRILSEDPPPPRRFNDKVHSDLETIALKAIERDPARRYPTARDFAEELHRYLSGEAIHARPAGLPRRVHRRLRKSPFLSGLGVGTVVAIAAGIGVWISGAEEARRAAVNREIALRGYRELARSSLESALAFRRAGLSDRIPQYLPRLQDAYRQVVQLAPDAAEPHYLMGRFQRVLLQVDAALRSQEEALRKDESFAPALYEHILLVSRRYRYQLQGERKRLAEVGSASPSFEEVEQGNRDFLRIRNRLLDDCDRLERLIADAGSAAASPVSLGEANVAAARGIVSFNRGRFEEAIVHLKDARAKDPLLEEVWETLIEAVIERPVRGTEQFEHNAREAEQYCDEALTLDRGYLPHLSARSEIRHLRGDDRMCRGQDPLPDFAGAEKDLTEVLRLEKHRLSPWRARGDILLARGSYRMTRGQDPMEDFAAAERDFNEGLRLRPGNFPCLRRRGIVRTQRGLYRDLRGEDPSADGAAAEKDLAEASAIQDDPALWTSLGLVRLLRGSRTMARGGDPTEDFDAADKNLSDSIRISNAYANAWKHRGTVRMMRGLYRKSRGQDFREEFSRAEEDFERGVQGAKQPLAGWLSSDFQPPWVARARLRVERAAAVAEGGGDPTADWAAAEQDLDRAIAANGTDAEAWSVRGRLLLHRALRRESRGEKEEAVRDADTALQALANAVKMNSLLESGVARDREAARHLVGKR
jgi:tetratricopeptide (TPR) repeat protein